jgi:hypothetical protein
MRPLEYASAQFRCFAHSEAELYTFRNTAVFRRLERLEPPVTIEGVPPCVLEGIEADLRMPILVAVVDPFPRVSRYTKAVRRLLVPPCPCLFPHRYSTKRLNSLDREN